MTTRGFGPAQAERLSQLIADVRGMGLLFAVEIGKVICGELEGRQSDDQVTVFDSTGIALQDSATVPLEYERAVAAGVGVEKKMIST